MPLQHPAYNTDWIFSNTSNVHVAKHKEWFFNYTPFATSTTHLPFAGSGLEAIGVGDVRLEVNIPSSERGKQAYITLVLRDVLHCPDSLTNILGLGAMSGYEPKLAGPKDSWLKHKASGLTLLLDHVVLWKLWLVGQPKGQTSLEKGGLYYINAQWSGEERKRFEAYKEELKRGGDCVGDGGNTKAHHVPSIDEQDTGKGEKEEKGGRVKGAYADGEYTAEEKKWIKKHYDGEFKFLMVHGLKMHNEEDREEGRQIARAFMSDEAEENRVEEGVLEV